VVQVEDRESFLMTRELLLKEGLYCGISSGSAVVGAMKYIKEQGEKMRGKKVLVILPDSGNRYMSKVFDDDWMKEAGFLETSSLGTVKDLLQERGSADPLIMAQGSQKVSQVIDLRRAKGISQAPVRDEKGFIKGIASEGHLLTALYEGRAKPGDTIDRFAEPTIEFVTADDTIERVSQLLAKGKTPLVVDPAKNDAPVAILTKIDLLAWFGRP
jgi:cystathionine beta-synthase